MDAKEHSENDKATYTAKDMEEARQHILRQENAVKFDMGPRAKPLSKDQIEEKAKQIATYKAIQREAAEKAAPEKQGTREEDRQRQFNEWETKKREVMRLKQETAERVLRQSQAAQRERLEAQLKDHSEARQKYMERLAVIAERQEKGSFLSRKIDSFKGIDNEREALQKNMADAEMRINDASSGLHRQSEEWTALHRLQLQEVNQMEQTIEGAREAGHQIPSEPGHSIPRDRGDRGYER